MPKRPGLREELERIRAHVDALFEDALVESGYGGRSERPPGTWSPPVDVVETPEAFLLYAELPGIDRQSIELHVEAGKLRLSGRREPPAEATGFLRMERSYGAFAAFEFASPIDRRVSAASSKASEIRAQARPPSWRCRRAADATAQARPPLRIISAVAGRYGIHPQTLRCTGARALTPVRSKATRGS
jgi:HSP20 family protein